MFGYVFYCQDFIGNTNCVLSLYTHTHTHTHTQTFSHIRIDIYF